MSHNVTLSSYGYHIPSYGDSIYSSLEVSPFHVIMQCDIQINIYLQKLCMRRVTWPVTEGARGLPKTHEVIFWPWIRKYSSMNLMWNSATWLALILVWHSRPCSQLV